MKQQVPLHNERRVPETFLNDRATASGMRELPRVRLNGVWYFRDERLREFRRCDNPHERITFDELLDAA